MVSRVRLSEVKPDGLGRRGEVRLAFELIGGPGYGAIVGASGGKGVVGQRPHNKSLNATAEAGFNCWGCLIGAGGAGQVGVK